MAVNTPTMTGGAVVIPPTPAPSKADPTPAPPLVQNTVADPVRKWTAVAVLGFGLLLEVLSAVVAAFSLGNASPLQVTGAALFAAGVAVIWDRQVPA
jgi:hypothetical protein